MPTPTTPDASGVTVHLDQRAADELAALEKAFAAGTLPEVDRRAPAPPIDVLAKLAEGYTITHEQNGVGVIAPTGQHGHGLTIDEAFANIGSVIVPIVRDGYAGRVRQRADGSEVLLDLGGVSPESV